MKSGALLGIVFNLSSRVCFWGYFLSIKHSRTLALVGPLGAGIGAQLLVLGGCGGRWAVWSGGLGGRQPHVAAAQ